MIGRIPVFASAFLALFAIFSPAHAETRLLQMPFACTPQGAGRPPLLSYTGTPRRYPIVRWGGSRRFNGRTILRYLVDCGGQIYSAIDIYMAAPRDERAYVKDGFLYIQTGSHRERVLIRPRRCRLVETVEEYEPPNNPCYYDILHPDCDPSRRYYRKVLRRVCKRAKYGYRRVPDFDALPSGFAPRLPDMHVVIRR